MICHRNAKTCSEAYCNATRKRSFTRWRSYRRNCLLINFIEISVNGGPINTWNKIIFIMAHNIKHLHFKTKDRVWKIIGRYKIICDINIYIYVCVCASVCVFVSVCYRIPGPVLIIWSSQIKGLYAELVKAFFWKI